MQITTEAWHGGAEERRIRVREEALSGGVGVERCSRERSRQGARARAAGVVTKEVDPLMSPSDELGCVREEAVRVFAPGGVLPVHAMGG